MHAYFTKTQTGLIPSDPKTDEWYHKLKFGEVVQSEFKKVRNHKFLRKYFALLNIGFDNWNPAPLDSRHGIPEKNFDRFRADVTILCGYYDSVVRLDGSVRIEAKSISFARMTEESFAELYNKTINVLLKHVYNSDMTEEALNAIVNQYLSFT